MSQEAIDAIEKEWEMLRKLNIDPLTNENDTILRIYDHCETIINEATPYVSYRKKEKPG